jgi:hypothetical protein
MAMRYMRLLHSHYSTDTGSKTACNRAFFPALIRRGVSAAALRNAETSWGQRIQFQLDQHAEIYPQSQTKLATALSRDIPREGSN